MSHFIVCALILKKKFKVFVDHVLVGADKLESARGDSLGALRRIAHNEHGLSERRSFLLYSSGIREDHIASRKEVVEIKHVERLDYADALVSAELAATLRTAGFICIG